MNRDNVKVVLTELALSYGNRFNEQYAGHDMGKVVDHWAAALDFADFGRWPAALRYVHMAVNNGRVPNLSDVVEACEARAYTGVRL